MSACKRWCQIFFVLNLFEIGNYKVIWFQISSKLPWKNASLLGLTSFKFANVSHILKFISVNNVERLLSIHFLLYLWKHKLIQTTFKTQLLRAKGPYSDLFSPNAGKYGPEKLRIRALFTLFMWATIHFVDSTSFALGFSD